MLMIMWIIVLIVIAVLLAIIVNSERKDSIPKIIHQTAPADKAKWNAIWEPCQQSWKDKFTEWEYKMWSDEDLDNLIKTKYNWFYEIFKSYTSKIMRIDSARYFILYEYGGIYADMDYECVKNFENILPKGKACAAESPWPYMREVYQNALMASPARHPFWEYVFQDLIENKNRKNVLLSTGPEVIRRVAEYRPDLFEGLPRKNFAVPYEDGFDPAMHSQSDPYANLERAPGPGVYARHHGTGEWSQPPDFNWSTDAI